MNVELVAQEVVPEHELRRNSLSVRLRDEEHIKLADEAYKLRTSASEFVRSVLKIYFKEKGECF